MEKNYFKYIHPGILVSLIIVLGLVIELVTDWLFPIINQYLSNPYLKFPSTVVVVSGIMFLIDEFLWNCPPFKWLYRVDDFSGTYEGVIEYQYLDRKKNLKTGRKRQVKVIRQSGSKIAISTKTYDENGELSSPSVNQNMYVEKCKSGNGYTLIYNYLNDGKHLSKNLNTHFGTEILKFEKDGKVKKLSGRYYTERDPYMSKGILKDFISKK
ncbi:MAG TPA: hypothetical protein VFF15_00500 [Flavobacteriaceae bacterium]|nr:hypothetical protein [Flavobacteriaceae bacterium]